MKILIVRHAEPDYAVDGLTQKGCREAELLAQRLCLLHVKNFYVSPLGRAQMTAAYTLSRMHRTAETLPWLHEFRGHCFDEMAGRDRICWDYRPRQWLTHPLLYDPEHWLDDPLLQGGNVREIWQETAEGVDEVLSRHGFHRDGPIYRCENNRPDTLVFFCHFGVGAAMVAHLCHIPPMLLWQSFCMQPSSVTTLITEERTRGEAAFRCIGFGDLSHLNAAGEPYSTAGLYPECYTGRDSTNPPEWDKK